MVLVCKYVAGAHVLHGVFVEYHYTVPSKYVKPR